jgi:hypothetical protein
MDNLLTTYLPEGFAPERIDHGRPLALALGKGMTPITGAPPPVLLILPLTPLADPNRAKLAA